MILIDNYDSFTYNIVQYLKELGIEPIVFKNDKITIAKLKKLDKEIWFSSIIISPGPKNPNKAGISLDVIDEFYKTKKILGICLGHQCIAQYFNCKIVKSKEPTHGKVSNINFVTDPIFKDIKQGFEATRYHSLIVNSKSITPCIKPLAYVKGDKSLLMGIKHKKYPVYGVQFHPEAILTQEGKKLLSNFCKI